MLGTKLFLCWHVQCILNKNRCFRILIFIFVIGISVCTYYEITLDRSLDNRGSALIFLCKRDADKCIVYSHFDTFVTEKNGKEINQQMRGQVSFLSRRFFIRLYIFHWYIVDT